MKKVYLQRTNIKAKKDDFTPKKKEKEFYSNKKEEFQQSLTGQRKNLILLNRFYNIVFSEVDYKEELEKFENWLKELRNFYEFCSIFGDIQQMGNYWVNSLQEFNFQQ